MKNTSDREQPSSRDREFSVVSYIFMAMFIGLAIWFVFFLASGSEEFINSPYNPRLSKLSETTIRGQILSSDGKVLAETKTDANGNEYRNYPYANEYAHAVGFSTNGMSGAELSCNFELLRSHSFFVKQIVEEVQDQKVAGDSAVLTIDSALQDKAYQGMAGYNGAVIALEPSTGKILCMVSKPDFNPNTIASDWERIVSDPSSTVLLNRATQGLYPPGSTGKIFTALEYLEEGKDPAAVFDCGGTFTADGFMIHCYKSTAHGAEDLTKAFADSCNCAFANMGLSLDRNRFTSLSTRMLFNRPLPTKLQNVAQSSFSLTNADSDAMVMQTSIGQGDTLVTPIHLAMVSAAVANGGTVESPYLVDSIVNDTGVNVRTYSPSAADTIMPPVEAEMLKGMMRSVVTYGTGTGLLTDSYDAYGKTGTAEYTSDKNQTHSWFTGFAEKDGRRIAVAIIMEGAGTSSAHAVPLARSIFDTYFQN